MEFKEILLDGKKMQIISSVAYEFAHYDNSLNYIETDTLKTGDYLRIRMNAQVDEMYDYQFALLGDVNGDGTISPLDYVKIKNHIMGSTLIEDDAYLIAADANSDSEISPLDYVRVKNYIMNGEV